MGFKRTPEGRVFFQGADGGDDNQGIRGANDEAPRPNNAGKNAPRTRAFSSGDKPANTQALNRSQPLLGDVSQAQILTLLKTLNERLKLTQADRDTMMRELESYRGMMEDLEEKAARSERLALDLEHKLERQSKAAQSDKTSEQTLKELEETRRLLAEVQAKADKAARNTVVLKSGLDETQKASLALAKQQSNFEQQQKAQNQALAEKLEETGATQAKLNRRIDKAIEDRARFMRKIERIEETVIQTRDSLNAKAMVLLTEQGATARSNVTEDDLGDPDVLAAMQKHQARRDALLKPHNAEPWYANISVQQGILAAVFLALICVFAIWAFIAFQPTRSGDTVTLADDKFAQATPDPAALQAPAPVVAFEETTPAIAQDGFADAPQVEVEPQIEAVAEDPATQEPVIQEPQVEQPPQDIPTLDIADEDQMAQLLEDDPQTAAQKLNTIEPQIMASAADSVEAPVEDQPAPVMQTAGLAPQEEPITSPEPVQIEETPQPKTAPAKTEQQLRAMIGPDKNLPNIVKNIEDQAFAGIGEAQHDLAAIYTAGHGGVAQDYKRAAFWFERAAENGIANASYNLAVLHHQGLGMPADIGTALLWYEDAARKGHAEAQYNLGIAHIEGIGVPYNPSLASRYFEDAANKGIVEAAYNLGLIYENGLLGSPKPDEALVWYKNAADQG
ncbi:MAG: hypothetical protein ACPGRX_08275, partial [Bdellovibrionales bacterium]